MKFGRPLIYMLIIVVLVIAYTQSGVGKNDDRVTITVPPDPISQEQIFKDFINLDDNEIPVEPTLGGKFFTTALKIDSGFKGVDGDHFYAAIEDGHVSYILEYSLKEQFDRKLVYQVSKVIEGATWPSGNGEVYIRNGQGFKKQ